MFNSYRHNCVHSYDQYSNNQHANGTFFSRNLYALAFNYASSLGNRNIVSHENQYNQLRVETCLKYSSSNQQEIHNIKTNLTNILQSSQVILFSFLSSFFFIFLLIICNDYYILFN